MTTNKTHTPGPWGFRDGNLTTWTIFQAIPGSHLAKHPNFQPIAEIPHPDHDNRGVAEADANARLIAASPVLLEALQAVSRLDYLHEHNALAKRVREAIALATGQPPSTNP